MTETVADVIRREAKSPGCKVLELRGVGVIAEFHATGCGHPQPSEVPK